MPRKLATLLVSWLLLGCGVDDAHPPDAAVVLSAELGFLDVEADTYHIDGTELSSSPARLFYSFHPATVAPDRAPLLVLHAGGPVASSLYIMAYGTAEQRLDLSAVVTLVHNADSLTDVAHLLYLDPRQAGFSYSTLVDPSIDSARVSELSAANYNPYRDAADMLEGLLAFLRTHPTLANRQTYFVGESYGGLRTSLMSNFLLFATEYAAGTRRFVSPNLVADVHRHFEARFGHAEPAAVEVATQFRGQILIEPWFAGDRQAQFSGPLLELPGSILDEVAAETGTPYRRCAEQPAPCVPYDNALAFVAAAGRSIYDVRAPEDWLAQHSAVVTAVGTNPSALAALFGVTAADLAGALAGRGGAYRFADPARGLAHPQGDLIASWGAIQPWDAYFADGNEEARSVFYASQAAALAIDPRLPAYGELLVENLRYLSTFVSRATYDVLVYAPALPPTLASYPSVSQVTEPADGVLRVEYTDGTVRSIVSPHYATSHSVERDDPAHLHDDIAAFLR
jgi:hypothetical protein